MMLNKLLANRKVVIVAIALLLAVCVGVIILVTSNSKETGGKDTNTKTEQGKEHVDLWDDNNEDDDTGLEVLEPNQVSPEDSSDVSGSWGDESESNIQNGDKNITDKTDDTNKRDEQTPSDNPNQTDKEDNDEEPEKDEDILEDDITWGDIY